MWERCVSLRGITGIIAFKALKSSYKLHDWTHDRRPPKYQNVVDPRIIPSTQESPILKFVRYVFLKSFKPRFIDMYTVKGVMNYLLMIRNHTHYFGIHNLRDCLDRPENVGLLTVSNHVTTIDSASLPSPLMHFKDLLNPRNCGYWNLAREDETHESVPKSMVTSLVKIMPIHRGGGVHQIALTNFIQRVKNGEWCHIFPEGRTYQVSMKEHPNQ